MDFIDQVKNFAASVPAKLEFTKTEEATKNFLIMPFIQQILGYDAFNPNEIMPEFDANVGAARKFKLDYAIFKDGEPTILIECKCYGNSFGNDHEWSQLFAYFMATDARIGVLTNGVVYKFYADLEKPNKMDKTPFLELDLLNLNESAVRELYKLTKFAFNITEAITAASELKYVGGIKTLLKKQTSFPDDEFVRYFFKGLCPENNFVGQLKEDFKGYTQKALEEFIREEIDSLLDKAIKKPEDSKVPDPPTDPTPKPTILTEEELEGYYIIKSILCQLVDPKRITHKDAVGHCNILLDGNNWRQIARLYFNNPAKKRLETFFMDENGNRVSEMAPLANLNEIYSYTDRLKSIVEAYERPKAMKLSVS